MSGGRLALPTLILGGIGTVFMLGATEGAHTDGLLAAAGLATWGFLALCWVVAFRNARYAAWARSRFADPTPKAPRSAFWKGAAAGLCAALTAVAWGTHLTGHGTSDGARQAGGAIAWLVGSWGALALPLLTGAIWSKIVATRVPRP